MSLRHRGHPQQQRPSEASNEGNRSSFYDSADNSNSNSNSNIHNISYSNKSDGNAPAANSGSFYGRPPPGPPPMSPPPAMSSPPPAGPRSHSYSHSYSGGPANANANFFQSPPPRTMSDSGPGSGGVARRNTTPGGSFYGHSPPPTPRTPVARGNNLHVAPVAPASTQRSYSLNTIAGGVAPAPGVASPPPAAMGSGFYASDDDARSPPPSGVGYGNDNVYQRSVSVGSHGHGHGHGQSQIQNLNYSYPQAVAPASGSSFQSSNSGGSGGGGYVYNSSNNNNNNNNNSGQYGSNVAAQSSQPQAQWQSPSQTHSSSIYGIYSPVNCRAATGNNLNNFAPSTPSTANAYASAASANRPTSFATPKNPYQKPKKTSLGTDFASILTALLFLAFLTLASTTLYYRHTYNSLQQQLEAARQVAETINHDRRRGHRSARTATTQQQQNELASLQSKVNTLTSQRDRLQSQSQKFTSQLQALSGKIDTAERMRDSLQHEMDVHNLAVEHSQEEVEKYQAMVEGRKELEGFVIKRETALWERIDNLKEKVKRLSHREGMDWFGEGPHRVEITLEYPQYTPDQDVSTWPRITKPFIIELAPLSLMPHTVTFFLTQVHYKLWNGIHLHHNMNHIYHFGVPAPHVNDIGDVTPSMEYLQFQNRKLDKVIFQEYHPEYPHEEWTVGFSGRPSGTEFYVNKLNNTIIHGPGGQPYDAHADVDPCFGKVVEGRDVFEEINKIPSNHLLILDGGGAVIQSIRPLFLEKNPVDEKMKRTIENVGLERSDSSQ